MSNGTFEIAWNRSRLQCAKRAERAPWVEEAILCERVLLAGKPQLRIVTRLAKYAEDRRNDPGEIDRFWASARHKLGRLRRLSPREIWAIEILLAKRVPKPVAASQAAE
jgi:hypothetical protein